MTARVVVDVGCCPLAGRAAESVRAAGGKVVELPGPARARSEAAVSELLWPVAAALGLHPGLVRAGCPVPFLAELDAWSSVADELARDRADLVVLRADGTGTGPNACGVAHDCLQAPARLDRLVGVRLREQAGDAASDPLVASEVADLLRLRARLAALVAVAREAVVAGRRDEHADAGCSAPGLAALGSGVVAAVEPLGPVRPGHGVRRDAGTFVWWLPLPGPTVPELHREDDRLVVGLHGLEREVPLPAVLRRCTAVAATVVPDEPGPWEGSGTRLEVRFEPDPGLWR